MPTQIFNDGENLGSVRNKLNEGQVVAEANETKLATIETNAKDDQSALEVPYDNTTSGLTATNVKAAIDELAASGPSPNTVVSVNGIPGPTPTLDGDVIAFDGGVAGMSAANVQDALYELDARLDDLETPQAAQDVAVDSEGTELPESADVQNSLVNLDNRVGTLEGAAPGGVTSINALTGAVNLSADAVPFDPDGLGLSGSDVQAAIAELAALGLAALVDASGLSYDNTASKLTASNVQAAIDEIVANPPSPDASSVTFDNADSGLTATNVQTAIDEVEERLDTAEIDVVDAASAAGTSYDNTSSFLPATTVQAAIDFIWSQFGLFVSSYKDRVVNIYIADHTLLDTDDVLLMNTGFGDITLTLPAPAGHANRVIRVKNAGAATNKMTIDAATNGSLIDGAATFETNTPARAVTVVCDGSLWWLF